MRIVLGVSGGIAAYKAAELARVLIRNGHEVQVVLTRAAEEFIRPLTFAALTGRKVITDLFSSASPEETLSSSIEHIGIAQDHDLLLVAPATANLLANFAGGLAGDFLSTLYLAFRGPVILAPAMNNNMWEHPATRANVERLRSRGHSIVEPGDGFLACGSYGPGRLADTEAIAAAVAGFEKRDLAAQTILITAGPTQEPLDPVRYLSNHSSGRMGYALAEAALHRGARVLLISGPVHLSAPAGAEVIRVQTAAEMREAVFANEGSATVLIMCAAVADFRPRTAATVKVKKSKAFGVIELEPTIDILAEMGQRRGDRILIGFAAETENLIENARDKLAAKNCDMVVANLVGQPGCGFGSESNAVTLVLRNGENVAVPLLPKRAVADAILDRIKDLK